MLPTWLNAAHHYLRLRRCAVGIEIQPTAIRLVILSHSRLTQPLLRIEWMAQRDLPPSALVGEEVTEVMTLASAIADALLIGKQRQANVSRAVMALPNTALLFAQTSLAELVQHGLKQASSRMPAQALSSAYLNTLAPAIFAEAERRFKIEASELALDWFHASTTEYPAPLIIAAAPRHYVETYIEVALQAGLQLVAIDEENASVLRACRFAALHTLPTQALYSVIWLGPYQTYAWLVREQHIEHELIFSSLDLVKSHFIDKLQRQIQTEAPQQAFVAGEIDKLNTLGLSVEEIGQALHCKACAFEATTYCQAVQRIRLHSQQSASFALAFGLALRGVLE